MYEIDPDKTPRAESYKAFSIAPMPMVTIFQTLDVTRLVRKSKKGYKFNMLLAYCIGQAAKNIPEMLYQIHDTTMLKYDKFAIVIIVNNQQGTLNYCDVPAMDDLQEFNRIYLEKTQYCAENGEDLYLTDTSNICTSALVKYDIDGIVNLYHKEYDHPFLAWGKYHREWFRYKLKFSFQWHHAIMDGEHACRFLEALQKEFNKL